MQKPRRHSRSEQHHTTPNPERYLLTYADLITLLLGLFIILYASAQVDSGKYKEYAAAINQYFNNDNNGGGNGVMEGQRGLPRPILPAGADKTLEQIDREVTGAVGDRLAAGTISVVRSPNGLTVRMSEQLLFASGEAEIRPEARPVLDTLSAVLQGIRQSIVVEGHTDSIPIRTFLYESNWHLSVQRALNVGYYCLRNGIPQANVTISGCGAERPVASNATAEGRAQNRRVEIIIRELPQNVPTADGYITTDTEESPDNR